MNKVNHIDNRKVKWIRWPARIIGTIMASFWVLSLVASAITEYRTPIILEGIILAVLIVINTAGVIITWRREKIGGIIIVVAAAALSTFAYITAGHNKILAMLFSGFPFLISGILFLVSWWKSRR